MPTIEQDKAIRDALKTALKALVEINPNGLARESDLGTKFSFAEGVPYFEKLINLYIELDSVSLDGISYGVLNGAFNGANEVIALFKLISEFDPKQGPNPNDVRKRYIDSARDQYDSHYGRISPILAFAARKGRDFEEFERKARAALESVSKLTGEISKKGKDFENAAGNTLTKLQEAAGKFGVAQHAVNFREQAEEHFKAAQRWFWVTGGIVILSLIAIWLFFIGPLKPPIKDMTLGEIIYSVTSRLILFSISSFAIYWAAKNHSSHRHNYIVNKHRQNALVTFQTFIEAAGSDQCVKNAVLLQAGQAIYTSQPTGYSESVSGPVGPGNVVEIIKGAASNN